MTIERRALRHDDVAIRITHCGICHSDLHMARNDWGMSRTRGPGHEIVGIVTGSARTSPNTASATGSRSAAWSTAARSAASAIRAMSNSASKGAT